MVAELAEITAVERMLRGHEFVRGLSDAEITALLPLCSEASFDEDDLIVIKGQDSRFFYLLLTGCVVIELHRPLFNVCVQSVSPGRAFGWSALLNDRETVFQVRARERSTALRVDGPKLLSLCESNTALGVKLLSRALEVVAGRIKSTEARFAELCGVQVDPGLR